MFIFCKENYKLQEIFKIYSFFIWSLWQHCFEKKFMLGMGWKGSPWLVWEWPFRGNIDEGIINLYESQVAFILVKSIKPVLFTSYKQTHLHNSCAKDSKQTAAPMKKYNKILSNFN